MNKDSKIGYFIDIEGMISRASNVWTYFTILILLLLGSGCSITKYVPEDEYLLKKNEYELGDSKISRQELKNYVRQKPNKKILGIRFHLRIYNLSNPNKNNRFHNWLREIGEAPVIIDEMMTERTSNQLKSYLELNGYFRAKVSDTVFFKQDKAIIKYTFNPGQFYTINRKDYLIEDGNLSQLIYKDTINSLIRSGDRYQISVLQEESKRIEKVLRNEGYYHFAEEKYIRYEPDSSLRNNKVNMYIKIVSPRNELGNQENHKRFFINKVNMYPDELINFNNQENTYLDTTEFNDVKFFYPTKKNVSSKLLVNTNKIQKDSIYSLDNATQTYNNLSALRIFRFINMNFSEGETPVNGLHPLNADVRLVQLDKQKYEISSEFTNSRGNFGLGANFKYQRLNIFRGAEIFDFNFNMANQWREKVSNDGYDNYATYGLDAQVMIPKLIVPMARKLNRKNYTTKTIIKTAYDYQNWPFYSGTISNISYGYSWQSGKFLSHYFNPIDINSVKARDTTALNRRYAGNKYLLSIYNSHFVSVSSYSLLYNNQQLNNNQLNYTYFRINLESAGNLLNWYSNLSNNTPNENNKNEVFGLEYAQYLKADIDFRQSFQTSKTNNFVYRIFAGVGYPYKNSDVIPFERQYYSGGSNGMRAWRVWSLGPGSYFNDSIYNTGDIKLELNLEQRFKMFWLLEGAVFLDVGNIWSISEVDDREGAKFNINNFHKDLAVGTGFGLRLDLSFILIRFDTGLKLRDPSIQNLEFNETNSNTYSQPSKWVLGNPNLREGYDYLAFQIGLGYPF